MQKIPVVFLGREDPLEKEQSTHYVFLGFPGGSVGKKSACNAGPLGWEDPLEEGMSTHSSILTWRIPMDRGAWRTIVHGVAESQTPLSD